MAKILGPTAYYLCVGGHWMMTFSGEMTDRYAEAVTFATEAEAVAFAAPINAYRATRNVRPFKTLPYIDYLDK